MIWRSILLIILKKLGDLAMEFSAIILARIRPHANQPVVPLTSHARSVGLFGFAKLQPPSARARLAGKRERYTQFSTRSLGTRLNSFSLFVTSVRSRD
jgi:hypothetical protein